MNLIVDIGNTVLKAALCEGPTLGKTWRFQGENKMDFALTLSRRHHPSVMVICSGKVLEDSDISNLEKECTSLVVMDPEHTDILQREGLPTYITPDCVASIVAVRHMFRGKPCSIFDFGTLIESSFLDSEGNYLGGNISPGCTTRFRSINRYARNFPLLCETDSVHTTGDSLEGSIRSGVVSGIMFEIEGYMSLYPDNMAVFTGGDAIYFAKRTKNSIFVVCNLVLKGLALIADNDEKIS